MQVTAPQNAPHPFAKAKEAKNQKSPITKPSGHWTSMINRAAIVYQDWYSGCTCQSSVRRAFSPPRRPKIQDPRRKKTQVKTSFALLQTLSNANRNLDVWAATLPALPCKPCDSPAISHRAGTSDIAVCLTRTPAHATSARSDAPRHQHLHCR